MDKSKKISLIIVTILFAAIAVWKTVDLLSEKHTSVEDISLEGPAVVKLGEFDETKYKIKVTYSDKTQEEKPFYKAFIQQEDLHKLEEEGKHTFTFTYERCVGTFEIEIVV